MTKLIATLEHKLGHHRGGRRVWLEGRDIAAAGFTPGAHFTVTFTPGRMVLKTCAADTPGARRVTGKGDHHPIIDVTGKKPAATFGDDCARITVKVREGKLTVTPAE